MSAVVSTKATDPSKIIDIRKESLLPLDAIITKVSKLAQLVSVGHTRSVMCKLDKYAFSYFDITDGK
jgi:hypothetical protein